MTNHLVDEVGLAPLAGDLEPGRDRLRDAVLADDRFLGEVAGHLLAAGGKRLRPTLVPLRGATRRTALAAPRGADAITGGAAVELVHLGSLYHDDVIDEAETRRGVPCVNARWSNIVAILAGDYLLAQASVARRVARRRRRRRCSRRRSASCAAVRCSSCSTCSTPSAARSRTSRRSRARPRR